MTLKRIFLFLLTLVTILFSGSTLIGSLNKPQFQSELELYQTNIVLLATDWQPSDDEENLQGAKKAILGVKPLDGALKQYQEARESAETNLEKAQSQLAQLRSASIDVIPTSKPQSDIPPVTNVSSLVQQKKLEQTSNRLQESIAELNLRIGIIQARQGNSDTAIKTWQQVQKNSSINPQLRETSQTLIALWEKAPKVPQDAELLIKDNLKGWFRYSALEKIYQLQENSEYLNNLKFIEQRAAEEALLKLTAIAILPVLGGFIGIALLIFTVGTVDNQKKRGSTG